MSSPSVLYLASNSLTNPNNTSGNFSILYNNPFSLSGKKIALVSATFTKGQANVLEELVTVSFRGIQEKRKGPLLKMNVTELAVAKRPTNWVDYFKSFNKVLYTPDGIAIMKMIYTFNPVTNFVDITIFNLSKFESEVSFLVDMTNGDGYVLRNRRQLGSSLLFQGVTVPSVGNKITLLIKSKARKTVKLDVSKHAAYSFELLQTSEEFRKRHEKLFQFLLVCYPEVKHSSTPHSIAIRPGPGNFDSIQKLLLKINKDPGFTKIATLSYSAGKVRLRFKPAAVKTVKEINFGGLHHHLGFDSAIIRFNETKSILVAQRPPDMTRGTHNFFIYSSLVKNVPVNEQMVPLLAVLDATAGEYGQQIQHHVRAPVFVDCMDGPQQKVEISIADDSGSANGLLQGNTMLTLAIQDA